MGEEKKGFSHGIIIGVLLILATQITLPVIPTPTTVSSVALAIMIGVILISITLYPLRVYRKNKDFTLYQRSLLEGSSWLFTVFQIAFVFLGNKPVWSLIF